MSDAFEHELQRLRDEVGKFVIETLKRNDPQFLDAITREELQNDLLRLCRLRRTTVLFVTHDIAEAVYLADRVAVMDRGRLRHALAVDLPRPRPPDVRYSARFNQLCREARQAMDAA